ncbi:MAG: hypothetical protein WCT39_06430 [Candidatus Margulisiibacteriota bacterium]
MKKNDQNQVNKMLGYNYQICDDANSLICFPANILNNEELIEKTRIFIRQMYQESGYSGFENEYDRYFDDYSLYLCVKNKSDEICAVQRVIHKINNELLPIEKALINNESKNERYKITRFNSVEITSFVFKSIKAIDLLVASIAHYGVYMGVKKAYALLDEKSKKLKKIYQKIGWEESEVFKKSVFFPGYGEVNNGRIVPTIWKVMELNEKKILGIAERINKYRIIERH